MGQVGSVIAQNASVAAGLGELLMSGIDPKKFASKPRADGKVINTNHPAFVYGHLSIYPARGLDMLGLTDERANVPAGFQELFSAGAECKDDPDCSIYPPMAEIAEHYKRSHAAIIERLREVSDDKLGEPNPREGRFREMAPTIGDACCFVFSMHAATHLGQVSAWRRCFGLPSVL
jgi:hypothetical protein